jgi:hypothetical protein
MKFNCSNQKDTFSITVEKNQIMLRSKHGVRHVTSEELFDLFNEAYHDKMIDME